MEDVGGRANPDPSDRRAVVVDPFEEPVTSRGGIVPEEAVDRLAGPPEGLRRGPVAGTTLLVRIFRDLTVDEL